MFGTSSSKKSQLLQAAQNERQLRLQQKQQEKSVIKIQAWVRMFINKRRFHHNVRNEFDACFEQTQTNITQPALNVFLQARKLLLVYNSTQDEQRFLLLCKTIVTSLNTGKEPKYWYMSVMLIKEWTSAWLKHIKQLLIICSKQLKTARTYISSGSKSASIYLSMLVTFTDCTHWKILKIKGGENIRPVMQQVCSSVTMELTSKGLIISLQEFLMNGLNRSSRCLNALSLSAVTALIIRVMNTSTMNSASGIMILILNVLTVPAYIRHVKSLSPDATKLFVDFDVYTKVLDTLHNYENLSKVYSSLDAHVCLCLIGNLLSLFSINIQNFHLTKDKLKIILSGLLNHCKTFVGGKHSGNSKWHPVFGWCNDLNKSRSNESYIHVVSQLKCLWKQPLVGTFFENLPNANELTTTQDNETKGSILRRAFMKTFKKISSGVVDLNEPIVIDICMTCDLYRTLTATLSQLKLEIVASLSLQEEVLVRLWRFIYSIGPGAGMKSILNFVNGNSQTLPKPLSSLLTLFCECSAQLIPILDDIELYETQKPFTCDDLVQMSAFLNSLVFRLIWNEPDPSMTKEVEKDHTVRNSALELLLLLYDRDCRRQFTPPNHWLIKEIKVSQFQTELKEKKPRALTILGFIPHVIPHMERVKIFHRLVSADKRSLGIDKDSRASALVSIKRSRLLEDGYEQLSRCSGSQLKGIVRVKFINDQGLDEAGIDQDGVFKEFLEDVISHAFDPQLNLFKLTAGGDEQRLYPSPTSFIHENHLLLFEFVGKMLAKALYEGILVDVPFASFFLNNLLQRQHSILYSSIDELPSLDPEMYKNLNFIKSYEGDVSDLALVFALDEDVLGQLVTHDLKPGGRAIQVNNSNRLTYIHLMARYRIHIQIKEQSAAFKRGFHSIISPEWLSVFSGPELQRLISGSAETLDLSDLRNNTRYYGGYHAGHQTISWLWDILNNDFSLAEKKLFLKFVTSCSNPPLLGFKHLEPQFSIRFVDCSEDEDVGDSVGSVVRGLFNVRKRNSSSVARLPTASTCFNLLKLPSYKKKTILRDKLKYAIKSGSGFELS